MRRLGLIGGMSWESTTGYYVEINRAVAQQRGGLHSADLLLHSLDFAAIEAQQAAGRWERAGAILADSAKLLEAGGAAAIVLCTNTMHKVADAIEAAVRIPLLHIADALISECRARAIDRAALLGTRFTMREPFLRDRLEAAGLRIDVPAAAEAAEIDSVIYEELCRGKLEAASRTRLSAIVRELHTHGAQAALLCCTELGLLLREPDCPVPLLDSAVIHARAAARFALAEKS